jgi:hypothetical protein
MVQNHDDLEMDSDPNNPPPPWYSTLMARFDDMAADRSQDVAERATLRAQFEELRELMTTSRMPSVQQAAPATSSLAPPVPPTETPIILTPVTPTTPQLSLARRKPLPMGPPFGGDKASFLAWKVTMEHKLRADKDFIGDQRDQFAFLWANLSISVQQEVAAWYETGGDDGSFHPENFLNYLTFCYADNHSREKAQANLENLRQGKNESFSDFFIRFQRLLMQSGGGAWDDEQKLNKLRRSLNATVRTVTLNRGVTRTDYNAAILAYQSIAVDIEAQHLEINTIPGHSQTNPKRDSDGDVAMTHVGSTSTSQNQKQGKKKANRIPDELYKRRKKLNLCVRCGSKSHYARECTNDVNHNDIVIAAAKTSEEGENQGEE